MKIFVSSRMKELYIERKTVIETIHFEGHTPLYIEAERFDRNKAARDTMLSLLADADAFLSIHYLSAGREFRILDGLTPIKYELEQFRRIHKNLPIFLFRRVEEDMNPNHTMVKYFEDVASELGTEIVKFERPDELDKHLLDALSSYREAIDAVQAPYRVTIRYVGQDFAGLVAAISETLFTMYRLNVDYISHAASEGHSTVCVSCSPREPKGRGAVVNKRQLQSMLLRAIRRELRIARTDGRYVPKRGRDIRPAVVVNVDTDVRPTLQFFVELRAIDAPGQLNAVCKVLRERGYNIDELQLRPTPWEYSRQTTITLRLSHLNFDGTEPKRRLNALEGALRYLVGVRSFRTRIIRRYEPAQDPPPG